MTKTVVLAVIALGLLTGAVVGYRYYRQKSVVDFASCTRAGYPILETYPEQCRGPKSQLFSNPSQSLQQP